MCAEVQRPSAIIMTDNTVKVRIYTYFIILFLSYHTTAPLSTHSKGPDILTFNNIQVNTYSIKIKFSKAEILFSEYLPLFQSILGVIATNLTEIYKTNLEMENIHSCSSSSYLDFSQLSRAFTLFKRAREQLPSFKANDNEEKLIRLNLFPSNLKPRVELLHTQLLSLQTWVVAIEKPLPENFFVGDELVKLKKNNKLALTISHHANQLRSTFVDITLRLNELFKVGLIRPSLIKALTVMASESDSGVSLGSGDKSVMMGCEIKTVVSCTIRKETRTNPKTLNLFKGLTFDNCRIGDQFLLDEGGVPHVEDKGDINLFLPIKPSPCLKGIMAENLDLIRGNCILLGKVSESFRITHDGIIILKLNFETNKILNFYLKRSPTKTDLPFKITGSFKINIQNFYYQVTSKDETQSFTIKNPYSKYDLCPFDKNQELAGQINKVLLPLGGTNAAMGGSAFVLVIGAFIYLLRRINKLQRRCNRGNIRSNSFPQREERIPLRNSQNRIERPLINNNRLQNNPNRRLLSRRIFSDRILRNILQAQN